jgi:hypothetical protein
MPPQTVQVWAWCLSCERCYAQGSFRWSLHQQMCPYVDCNAELVASTRSWSEVRRVNPHYPETPQIQHHYPLIQPVQEERTLLQELSLS